MHWQGLEKMQIAVADSGLKKMIEEVHNVEDGFLGLEEWKSMIKKTLTDNKIYIITPGDELI